MLYMGVMNLFCRVYSILVEILLANNVDPDQTPNDVASDLGLHCLPLTFYGFHVGGGRVVRKCWVNFQCRGVLQFELQ